jgi:hypothetical protein
LKLASLKTAAEIASDHGLTVVLGDGEWHRGRITVVDHPLDLSLRDGHTPDGDLVLFNAEDVQMVKIQTATDGQAAEVRNFNGRTAG